MYLALVEDVVYDGRSRGRRPLIMTGALCVAVAIIIAPFPSRFILLAVLASTTPPTTTWACLVPVLCAVNRRGEGREMKGNNCRMVRLPRIDLTVSGLGHELVVL